jgi:3-methyladenine DNA glycosylase/8-oxoguanine DNA glycosylase
MQCFHYGKREIEHLTRRDKKLGRAIGHIGMIERQVMPELFKALVHSVVAQQISNEMLLIFSLCRPDVVSWGDLAIRRGMMNLYGLKELSRIQFDRFRKRYSPYGSVASLYLWALSVNQPPLKS